MKHNIEKIDIIIENTEDLIKVLETNHGKRYCAFYTDKILFNARALKKEK